jgi:L-malate glycosyltransferase
MKIGIVCYPTLGGSGILATELGHELASKGHTVHFITYDIPFRLRLEKNIHFHEVEIHQYDLFKYPDYALTLAVKIANVSQRFDLDILHVHYAIPHATSAYLAKQILGTKKPVVITTLHGTDITLVGRDPAYFQVVKFSIEKSCGVTAVSKSLCNQTHQYFGIDKNIEVIYNFVIPRKELIGKKPRRHKFVQEDEKLLLHSSNYRKVKRVEDVVRIFLEVRKKVSCKLLFLGSGPGLDEIRRMVADLDLENFVYFLGKSREIDPYVASADLFLLPSAQESFGLAALEAMAYGVPVIASHVGGLPEVIDHAVTGFLAPVGDTGQMADYALSLLTDEQLYARFSRNGISCAQEKFSVDKILPQYEALYKKIYQETTGSEFCVDYRFCSRKKDPHWGSRHNYQKAFEQ